MVKFLIWFLCGLVCGFICGLVKFCRWLERFYSQQFYEIYEDILKK